MKLSKSIQTGTAMAMLALSAVFMSHSALAQKEDKTIIVCPIVGGAQGSADGAGNSAQFEFPYGITIDAAGNPYVADTWNHRIRKVTSVGEVSTIAGSGQGFSNGQGTTAQFDTPVSITIDAAGNLYVADTWNHRIRKITPNGGVSTLAGSGQPGFVDGQGSKAQFYRPSGITIDAAGNLYVADTNNHSIRKVTPEGVVSTLAGGGEGFADGQGRAAQFYYPDGIVIDPARNLYVADRANSRIRKITPTGAVTTLAGGEQGFRDGQGSAARFWTPSSIAIDAAGNLYVADRANDHIRKVTPQGKVTTLTDSEKGLAESRESATQFRSLSSIVIDTTGNLYVADTGNHRICKIEIRRP
jgi:sugar lactone lactonase YvrE